MKRTLLTLVGVFSLMGALVGSVHAGEYTVATLNAGQSFYVYCDPTYSSSYLAPISSATTYVKLRCYNAREGNLTRGSNVATLYNTDEAWIYCSSGSTVSVRRDSNVLNTVSCR